MRVLVLSATMGEGHNATARALAEAVQRVWPRATVRTVDTLETMGPGVGPAFRWLYVTNVQRTPWLYEYFYDSLWRHRWFAEASKRFVAEWVGRCLARQVTRFRPDLVLSTYPLGTAGLRWLRRRGRLAAPIAAWVSDFAPHPFWVYGDIEGNYVMHEVAVAAARRCVPCAAVAVSPPPVRAVFRRGDRRAARDRLALPADAFVAVLSCGSLGFGEVESATRELLEAHPDVFVVAACGRNERLARTLRGLGAPDRLRVLGWTDEMAALMIAADVVVTNAGGATCLEALACGRPVLMYRPIAAHGRANAALMARAGLALVCVADGDLADSVRTLIDEPGRWKVMADKAVQHCETTGTLDAQLSALHGDQPVAGG